jgi:hypothetical protein
MSKPKAYKLMRDDARPIEFDGVEIAVAELDDYNPRRITRAAIYRTVGGKFVAEYNKSCRYQDVKDAGTDVVRWEVERAKVSSFPSLEAAAESFRPGPLTTMLLGKLQDQLKGERIE